MAKDKIQSIKIVLTDGRTGIFSGRALFDPTKEDVTVQEMQVSEPRDVPEGYSMEIIDECDDMPVEVPMADDDSDDGEDDDTGNGGLLH